MIDADSDGMIDVAVARAHAVVVVPPVAGWIHHHSMLVVMV